MNVFFRWITFVVLAGFFLQCNSLKPVKTIENLRIAFNNESTASVKYSKFAQIALSEGFDTISRLFDATSESANIQANNHRKVLEKFGGNPGLAEISGFDVKTTADNLQAAINSEAYQMQTMYPNFIRDAENEKAPEAGKSFTWAWDTGKKHINYYRKALATVSKGNESGLPNLWFVCPVCGNTYNQKDLKPVCDFCLAKQESFIGYVQVSK